MKRENTSAGRTLTARHGRNYGVGVVALLAISVLVAACGESDSFPSTAMTTPPASACDLRLEVEPAFDLTLRGSNSCGGVLRLALRVATGDRWNPDWNVPAAAQVRVDGTWELASGGATRKVIVSNPGITRVNFVGLEWTATDLDPAVDRMLHDGYQGSSYSGIEAIPRTVPEEHGTVAHAGDDENSQAEIPGVSWWYTALANVDNRGFTIGADGATVLKTYIAADTSLGTPRLRIVIGVTGDTIPLDPGGSKALDGLFVTLGDVIAGLDAYAARVAALHPPVAPRRPPLRGWGSWNLYYDKPSAALIREEMAWAHDRLVPVGMTDFELDDGYMPHWGDWRSSPTFGADLEALAAEQVALALTPAIWVGPMYVDEVDPVVDQHPEWFLHTFDGALRLFAQANGRMATLDASHPQARAFIATQLRRLWDSGYRSFKLDFLYAGAIEGVRHTAMTALESYQQWMGLLRDTLPAAHLLGAGAPWLPSVGWVDSMRTGSDIGFTFAPEPHYPFYAAEARQAMVRSSSDAWWALDPDVVLLRGNHIQDIDAWSSVVVDAMAGGNYILGDGRQADDLRAAMALDPEILAMPDGRAARARDLMTQEDPWLIPIPAVDTRGEAAVPHLWDKESADGRRHWLAVFAWQADPYQIEIELPHGTVEIIPPAAAGVAGSTQPIDGRQTITVHRHGVRLFGW